MCAAFVRISEINKILLHYIDKRSPCIDFEVLLCSFIQLIDQIKALEILFQFLNFP